MGRTVGTNSGGTQRGGLPEIVGRSQRECSGQSTNTRALPASCSSSTSNACSIRTGVRERVRKPVHLLRCGFVLRRKAHGAGAQLLDCRLPSRGAGQRREKAERQGLRKEGWKDVKEPARDVLTKLGAWLYVEGLCLETRFVYLRLTIWGARDITESAECLSVNTGASFGSLEPLFKRKVGWWPRLKFPALGRR